MVSYRSSDLHLSRDGDDSHRYDSSIDPRVACRVSPTARWVRSLVRIGEASWSCTATGGASSQSNMIPLKVNLLLRGRGVWELEGEGENIVGRYKRETVK